MSEAKVVDIHLLQFPTGQHLPYSTDIDQRIPVCAGMTKRGEEMIVMWTAAGFAEHIEWLVIAALNAKMDQ